MKNVHRSRLTWLAGAASVALLAATWPGADDDAAQPSPAKRPRAAQGAAAPTPSSPAQPAQPAKTADAVGLRATDLLGGTALAAPAAGAPAARPAVRDAKALPADRQAAIAALDTTLVAQRGGDAAATDAFASKSWLVASPPPPPAPEAPPPPPPPPPQAPPLPFKYMGSMQEAGGRTVWYLLQGDRLIVAGVGDVIDSAYRAEGIEGGQLRLTYLPLNQRQSLSIGVPP